MAISKILYEVGQRVRINEEEDPATYVGKMAIIERVGVPDEGEPICALKVDRFDELIMLPQKYIEPVVTKPSSLLANDLFLPWDMDNPKTRFQEFTNDRWIAGRILESLIYYDRVVIPTVDYSVIVPLLHWLGGELLTEMLKSDSLSFVRYDGTLGYIGNGNGLTLFVITPGEKPDIWWVRASRCSPQEAVALQIQNRLPSLKEGPVDSFAKLVEVCTVDTVLPQFQQKVADETYRDILGSDVLHAYFSIRNTNLTHLTGVKPNQVRSFSRLPKPAVAGDEIDITLRVAMLNLETYLSEEAGVRDMVTDRSFGHLLHAKVQRYAGGRIAKESFSRLMTMETLPDLVSSIMAGELDSIKLWYFRNKRDAHQFRQRFDKEGPIDLVKLIQQYTKMLRDGGIWSSGKAE